MGGEGALLIYLQMIDEPEEESKFMSIYRAYRNLAYHIAYGHMQHEQDAEDIVQYVFMKIAENIKIIEPVSPKTKRYIVTMVNNRVCDVLRSRGRHTEYPLDEATTCSDPAEQDGVSLLSDCILKLPPQQRTVILLKYDHGYSLREIAKMLNISLAWAQKLDQRAKKRLEKLYTEGGGTL